MARALLLAGMAMVMASAASAEREPGFAAIAFHDVVDTRAELTDDAVTTQSLVDFFDWMKAEGWTAVSLDAVEAAGRGGPPLPDKAILLSFDDGYRGIFDRVYPLLLAYRYPAVVALVGSWMDTPEGGTVDYGGTPVPRARFVTWSEVRRMQASGLVEIASHSHDLHRVVPSTPQGNSGPSARTWAWQPAAWQPAAWRTAAGRYETDAEHKERIEADLRRSRSRIADETGRPPRALVWPFGRHSGVALEAARNAGFGFAFTLEPERADARLPMALHRYYPTGDPSLGVLAYNLGFPPRRAETVRLACVDLAPMAKLDGEAQDAWLGELIEGVRRLGATDIVLDIGAVEGGAMDGGKISSAWLPGTGLPPSADIFGRAARQLGLRAGVSVHARIPLQPALASLGPEGPGRLAAAAARAAPIDGLLVDPAPAGALPPEAAPTVTAIRAARSAAPATAIADLFAKAAAIDPRLRLLVAAPDAGPGSGTDRQLAAPAGSGTAPWLVPAHSGRLLLPVGGTADEGVGALQRSGATALALCPWNGEPVPGFSAATFPWLP